MSPRLRVVGPLLALAAALALVGLVPPLRRALTDAVQLLARADVGALRAYVLDFGAWAPLVSAALMILQAVAAPLPSSPVTYVNGLVFGTWWGGLLSWASALVAAAICFWLSRRFGRPIAERLVTRRALEWSDAFFAQFGAHAVLIGRLLPVVRRGELRGRAHKHVVYRLPPRDGDWNDPRHSALQLSPPRRRPRHQPRLPARALPRAGGDRASG